MESGARVVLFYIKFFVCAVVVCVQDVVDLIRSCQDVVQGCVVVHKVYQGRNKIAHVRLDEVGSAIEFRGKVG